MNIIQNLPTAALYVDRGKIFCNQHFIKLTGYQPDAFHSVQHLFELLFAENNQESIEKLYQNEVAISNPVQLKTLKQDLKMVTVHQFQELDYKIIVFNDITALKNSEKLLNKSNYFIENLAEAVPHILFIFDIEKNKSIYVNDAVFTILQFSKSDLLLFQNIYEIAHPDDVLNIKQHIEFLKKMEDNDTAVLEYRLKNKSGNYLWFRSTQKIFKRNKNGATRQVIGVAENINELRERTLRNEKNILFLNRINAQAHHFFTKKLPDAFLSDFLESIAKVVDADSITIYQKNEHDILEVKFEWLSGSATKQQAKKIPAYLSEKLSLFEANQLLKIVANKSCVAVPIFIEGTFWGITDFVFHPENNVFHYIQDDVWKNFSLYLAGLFLKQKIDEEILQQKNIAEYASKIKSAFLNSISHEINTPLNIISGISETLPSENLVNEINKSDILLLKHSALDLKYLVEQIVVFNKIQPKENFSVNTRFDVKQWIEELQQDLLWIQSDENQPQLQWQIDENLPKTLTGKPLKLQHALKGIVQHFCKKKSSEKIHIIIGVEQENEQVVALNFTLGHPIVLKDLNRFSYLDLELKTLIENPSGLGINLLVALYIIQSLDGKIISISLDKDFQLSFNIPFQKEAVAIKPFDVDLSNKRILVIDDNEINMLILRKYLEKVNAQVTTINAAQEAIDLLKVEKFDAILLDWLMPEIDGAATLVELKKNKITTPVIATSAAAFSELKNQFNEYSIAAFLPKPITSELLYQKLTEVMRSKENVI